MFSQMTVLKILENSQTTVGTFSKNWLYNMHCFLIGLTSYNGY